MKDLVNSEGVRSEKELQEAGARQIINDYLKLQVSEGPRMISVGCQFGYEANPFLDAFPEGTYLGIDIDERMISGAKKMHSSSDRAVFDSRDARDKEAFGTKKWDVVFLGHPQTQGSYMKGGATREDWEKIIGNSAQAITEEGVILATTHLPQEADLVEKYLKQAGLQTSRVVNPKPVQQSIHADIVIGKK